MASVTALFRSTEKRKPREQVTSLELREDIGVVGDVRSGDGPRQVWVIGGEEMEGLGADSPILAGRLGENIRTEGILLHEMAVGDRIRIGTAVVELSELGRECHPHCRIKTFTGECIIPLEGVFAEVVQSGEIHVGDPIEKV